MIIGIIDTTRLYTLDTPYNEPLGGTQSAICYFIETMKTRGHTLYFYTNIKEPQVIRGVPHIPVSSLNNSINFDIIIVSCLVHNILEIKLTLNNNNTLYCLWTGHDIDQLASKQLNVDKHKDYIDLFIFVSKWQRDRFINEYNINYKKTLIMRNGIGKPFEKYLDLPFNKNNNTMTYCSIPWRGLELLNPIYKRINEEFPDSSLKIFSGMNIYDQPEITQYHDMFKSYNNVTYNYGVNQEVLASELYKIDFLTYPNTFPETSCITVLQAMAAGCLVITSDLGALRETMDGLNDMVDIEIRDFNPQRYIDTFTITLKQKMLLPSNVKDILREKNRDYIKKNYTWSIICKKFEDDISLILERFKKYNMEYSNILREATVLYSNNNMIDAIKKYEELYWYPNFGDYYTIRMNLGVAYYSSNKSNLNYSIAKKHFKICKDLKNDFNINRNLAILELEKDNIIKFMYYAKEALKIDFNSMLATLVANKMEEINNYHEAMGFYEAIIKVDPTNIVALNNLGNIYLLMISQSESINDNIYRTYKQSLEIAIKNNEHRKKELIISNIIFNNLYNHNISETDIYKNALEWPIVVKKDNMLVEITTKLSREINKNKKIRIGYISTDFITHPVGFMFMSILKNYNMEKYEVFCYDNSGKNEDSTAKKLRSYSGVTWHNINTMEDKMVLETMVNDNLDIMVDMMGHTRNNRMNIIQYKPARIIISYFAYPSTSGIKEIDYKITDIYATPPETQEFFTEKLYNLPNGFQCYTPPEEIISIKDYNRNGKYTIHLACFNNPIKLSIPTIETFSKILKLLPEAKLFLRYTYYKSSFYKESIMRLFMNYGIDRDQLDIGFDNLLDSLLQYNKMDIVLDPFPYNGGTISSEALYMNTPIITLAGTNYVSRVGVSLLSTLGLGKYIANTKEEYIMKVVDLARNTTELRELHTTIRDKMQNTDLLNSKSFTKHLEDAYDDMIDKYTP